MSRRLKILAFLVGAGLGAVATAVALYLVFSGPHMKDQAHITAFNAPMPQPPVGSVPVEPYRTAPDQAQAAELVNPLEATPENLAKGQVYYGYYCAFCHAADGSGNAPVGASYVPGPPDLASAKVRAMSDGELLRAMLSGPGHEGPDNAGVLGQAVYDQFRWQLVLYVRELAGRQSPPVIPERGIALAD